MDKNNDIKVNKISKWDAAPKNMGTLFTYIELVIGMACSLPSEIHDNLYDLMDKALDEYNELEAKYQEACGMISQYEDENRILKKVNLKQSNEVDDLEADIRDLEVQVRVNTGIASAYESEIKQVIDLAKTYGLIIHDDRKDSIPDNVASICMCGHYYVLGNDLKNENDRLRNRCNELAFRANKYSWAIKTVLKKASFSPGHIAEELRFMARESTTIKDVTERWKWWADVLLGGRDEDNARHIDLLDKLRWALEDKGIRVEWNEAALKWNLYDKTNTTCESCKQHYEDELKIRCKEIDNKNKLIEELTHENREFRLKNLINRTYGLTGQIELLNKEINGKNKLIDELKQKIEDLESKNKCLDFKFHTYKTFSYVGHIRSLKDKIRTLEKENKELKDTIEKDGEFGRNVGNRVADSIREGCDKGIYELHPLTRIDIHVEETNNMPTTFDRHAIPRIAVMFNNTQTEMERDTAEHECEELEKKFKELVKENEDLRTTFALCERDANMARELCHTIAFNAERARNKTPWFNE